MKSTTKRRRRSSAAPLGLLSVPLPPELLARLEAEARRRKLMLATTARQLLDERLRELEQSTELSRVEEWQRAEAWATWEKIKAGDVRTTSVAALKRANTPGRGY